MVRLALIGDVHGHWDALDAPLLDGLGYDVIVVLGDLAGLRHAGTLAVARGLAALRTPAVWVPGNHDAAHPAQLLAEVAGQAWLGDPLASLQQRRLGELTAVMGAVQLGAYSLHPVGGLTLVAGRPFAMGGPTLSFPGALAEGWGVTSLEVSAARLCALVDAAPTDELVWVAHNGPAGLGARRGDLWGCDFRAAEGDWGDPDLAHALAHAAAIGKRVRLVAAGHMHRRLRGGGQRTWRAERDGVVYVNAAEVPRIRGGRRHHVAVSIDAHDVTVEDVWLAA